MTDPTLPVTGAPYPVSGDLVSSGPAEIQAGLSTFDTLWGVDYGDFLQGGVAGNATLANSTGPSINSSTGVVTVTLNADVAWVTVSSKLTRCTLPTAGTPLTPSSLPTSGNYRCLGVYVAPAGTWGAAGSLSTAVGTSQSSSALALSNPPSTPAGTLLLEYIVIGNAAGVYSIASTADARVYIDGKILANAALTGVPTAPTAASPTNNTQIATTAFVHSNSGAGPTGPTGPTGPSGTGPTGPTGPSGPVGLGLTLIAKSANYTAVSGNFVEMTGAHTVTLPTVSSGSIVGVISVDGGPCTIAGSANILGPGIPPSSSSIQLSVAGLFVILEADGTNWNVMSTTLTIGTAATQALAGNTTILTIGTASTQAMAGNTAVLLEPTAIATQSGPAASTPTQANATRPVMIAGTITTPSTNQWEILAASNSGMSGAVTVVLAANAAGGTENIPFSFLLPAGWYWELGVIAGSVTWGSLTYTVL